MAKLLKLRRGTTSQHSSFTGAEGEVTVDTDKDVLVVHDGSTAGGHAMAAQDMDNVPAGSILGTQLENSGVTAGQYGSSSAIPIVTVDAQGLVTAASTTAIDSTTIANGTSNVAVANNGNITATRSGTARLVVDDAGVDVTGALTTTGSATVSQNVSIEGTSPTLNLTDSNANSDFQIKVDGGHFDIKDVTNNVGRLNIQSDGTTTVSGNLNANSGIDVTGNITSTGKVQAGDDVEVTVSSGDAFIVTKGGTNQGHLVKKADGTTVAGLTNGGAVGGSVNDCAVFSPNAVRILAGGTNQANNLILNITSGGVGVTGDISVTGNVDGVDVAALKTSKDSLSTTNGALVNGVTATTQAQSDNSTKVSTTAYVRTAISEAQAFPSGTKMLFQQTSAPTGWTKQTSGVDNKALRVVSGTAGSGGTNAFSNTLADRSITANSGNATAGGNISVANTTAGGNVNISSVSTSGTVNSHTLTINQIPSHSHNYGMQQRRGNNTNYRNNAAGLTDTSYIGSGTRNYTHAGNAPSSSAGGGGGHSHGFTGSSHNHNGSLSGTAHTHNATFTGSAHNHSISVTNLDMAVQYLDVIIAAKD